MNSSERERAHEFNVQVKRPLAIVRGLNARVWDEEGREYVDCVSGHGVGNLGHAHPRITAAIAEQAARLGPLSNGFANDVRARLLERLAGMAPAGLGRAFLCNSGTEAVEAAIKFARFTTGRTDFVCAMRGFHGRTLGALSATFRPEYRAPFEPLVPGFSFAPFNDFDKFAAAVTERTAGLILEPIQGESGVHPGDPEFFQRLRRLCDERGLLLIVDEVQTGCGRTGSFLAVEQLGVTPDVVCLAKAIAGGLPMGAVLCSEKVKAPVGRHGTTFGGNPLCCAAALAALDVLEEDRLAERALRLGERFVARLHAGPLTQVREIRHRGLMIGIETRAKAQPLIEAMTAAGVLTFPAGATVIRVYPPLTIEEDLLDLVADRIASVLA